MTTHLSRELSQGLVLQVQLNTSKTYVHLCQLAMLGRLGVTFSQLRHQVALLVHTGGRIFTMQRAADEATLLFIYRFN